MFRPPRRVAAAGRPTIGSSKPQPTAGNPCRERASIAAPCGSSGLASATRTKELNSAPLSRPVSQVGPETHRPRRSQKNRGRDPCPRSEHVITPHYYEYNKHGQPYNQGLPLLGRNGRPTPAISGNVASTAATCIQGSHTLTSARLRKAASTAATSLLNGTHGGTIAPLPGFGQRRRLSLPNPFLWSLAGVYPPQASAPWPAQPTSPGPSMHGYRWQR